ncbi:MAG: YdcF family protein [Rhodospirillales bacterium]|nr:YdcF family protein [Rhodospirillales bacterium]
MRKPPPHRLGRALRRVITGAFALWFAGFLGFVWTLPAPEHASGGTTDGIVVLTGGSARIDAGLQLLRNDRGERLLISGVDPRINRITLRKTLRQDRAAFDCCVDLGTTAADTRGNAREISRWAADRGYRSLTVVTANYHMPRSLIEIKRAAPGITLVPFPVVSSNVPIEEWWMRPRTTALMVSEYSKYLVSLTASWFSPRE